MTKIKDVRGREILDSRGNPTVEVDMVLESGAFGRASVPSGASTGSHEAVELRDKDVKRYSGEGVLEAVQNINTQIKEKIINNEFDQNKLDETLIEIDGTKNKGRLGANAILGVSLAFAKAYAKHQEKPLYRYFEEISQNKQGVSIPIPMMNILNGGKHAKKSTDLQEFMIVPHGAPNFKEALRHASEIFHSLEKILSGDGFATTVGDEGGFAPSLQTNKKALDLIIDAIKMAGYVPKKDVSIALDPASTEFYNGGLYRLDSERKVLDSQGMIDMYSDWISKYPIISMEDGLAEDDWDGWKKMTEKMGDKIQLVGDDLFVTNIDRLSKGIEQKVANSILIKLNQIGTVTETIKAINMAKMAGYTSVISHRSGETEDTYIADLAVGTGVGQIKTGSLSRGERVSKYNQLLRIEEELGSESKYSKIVQK